MKIKKIIALSISLLIVNQFSFFVHAFEPTHIVDIKGKAISWTNGLNNSIRVINYDNEKKYFKECKSKLNIHSEVKRIIDDYFYDYLDSLLSNDKKLISDSLFDTNNFEKFINMGFLWNRQSNLSKYLRGEISSSFLGIPHCVAEELRVDLKDFFLYSSRELIHNHISPDIEEGTLQTKLARKQLGTYILAKYFNVEDIVVKTEFIKLSTDYGEKIGVLTDEANGVDISELDNIELEINPKFQIELTNLQILDTITNEQDHNPPNCKIKVEGNKLVGVTAFDNEGCFGMNTDLQKGLCWGKTSPLLTKNNRINLPHMSKTLADKILNTEDSDIDNLLGDILTEKQVFSTKSRLQTLKSAIADTMKNNSNFLLCNEQWSIKTISDELSGIYGNTYLNHFCKKLNFKIS